MLSRCAAARPLVPPPMPSHDSKARPLPHGAEEDDDDGEHLFAQLVQLSNPSAIQSRWIATIILTKKMDGIILACAATSMSRAAARAVCEGARGCVAPPSLLLPSPTPCLADALATALAARPPSPPPPRRPHRHRPRYRPPCHRHRCRCPPHRRHPCRRPRRRPRHRPRRRRHRAAAASAGCRGGACGAVV